MVEYKTQYSLCSSDRDQSTYATSSFFGVEFPQALTNVSRIVLSGGFIPSVNKINSNNNVIRLGLGVGVSTSVSRWDFGDEGLVKFLNNLVDNSGSSSPTDNPFTWNPSTSCLSCSDIKNVNCSDSRNTLGPYLGMRWTDGGGFVHPWTSSVINNHIHFGGNPVLISLNCDGDRVGNYVKTRSNTRYGLAVGATKSIHNEYYLAGITPNITGPMNCTGIAFGGEWEYKFNPPRDYINKIEIGVWEEYLNGDIALTDTGQSGVSMTLDIYTTPPRNIEYKNDALEYYQQESSSTSDSE